MNRIKHTLVGVGPEKVQGCAILLFAEGILMYCIGERRRVCTDCITSLHKFCILIT